MFSLRRNNEFQIDQPIVTFEMLSNQKAILQTLQQLIDQMLHEEQEKFLFLLNKSEQPQHIQINRFATFFDLYLKPEINKLIQWAQRSVN